MALCLERHFPWEKRTKNAFTWSVEGLNNNMKHHLSYFFILIFLLISACSPLSNQEELTADPPQHTETAAPTWTVAPTGTQISSTPAPILQDKVCSPLETETLQTLQEIVTQPYKQPRIGIDDGPPTHHGVDFAHYRRGDLLSLEGVGILSALDGEVVTVINDRFPYGHAVIIETPLDTISPQLLTQFNLPEISSPVDPDPKFNWSPGELSFTLSENDYSIYIFYAHLLAAPEVEIGEQVTCGQRIGQVGNSGDSTNPHLHFETRIGPSGARFESMAYYIPNSTESERYNYIVWRITNLFQVFDPMLLLDFERLLDK
jgi:murein DD-endopeptidase MepM/ murein hydrolase activator NlpD